MSQNKNVFFSRSLDNGAKVFVIQEEVMLSPEVTAMVQALDSRDPSSIVIHLEQVMKKGPEKFMQSFYVGYGHKSIGDCGNLLFSIEGVSMLAAKAIQHSQLYNGQEGSTRYMDFSQNKFLIASDISQENSQMHKIQKNWRNIYLSLLSPLEEYLCEKYPQPQDVLDKDYHRTIKARVFDIARGFLPAGASTNLTWYTSISHAVDHLHDLQQHPLKEVRDIANALWDLCEEQYASSFTGNDLLEEVSEYKDFFFKELYYYTDHHQKNIGIDFFLKEENILKYKDAFSNRPKRAELHSSVGALGNVVATDYLDFGSFRDLQRHRAVIMQMPLLSQDFGYHPWYLQNLPAEIRISIQSQLDEQLASIEEIDCTDVQKQYLLPMCMQVPISIVGPIPKFLYLVELRSQSTVHPTLHSLAYSWGSYMSSKLNKVFGCDIPIYISPNSEELNFKRGKQTIEEKPPII